MTIELRLEHLFDAPPEVVFDAWADPAAQRRLHGAEQEGWVVGRAETDVRVGGTSIYEMGPEGKWTDVEQRTYTELDRPNRVAFRHSMYVGEWKRTIDTDVVMTFEEQDGKTLLTMIQTGFESEELRDEFLGGWSEYVKTLERLVDERQTIKARHDTST